MTKFDPGKFVTIFTDASFCPDTRAWGWAAWIKYGVPAETLRLSGGGKHCQGSNQAELLALQHGIEAIADQVPVKGKIVVVQSDCVGALSTVCDKALFNAGASFVRRKHVKGHQGVKCPRSAVNTWTDRAAREEMLKRRAEIEGTTYVT